MHEESRPEAEDSRGTQETGSQETVETKTMRESAKPQPSSRVAPSIKPGPFVRAKEGCRAAFGNFKLPVWDLRLFAWLLLGIVAVIFFVSNWSPMRFYFFGVHCELPRSVAMLVLLGLGFLAGWFARAPRNESEV